MPTAQVDLVSAASEAADLPEIPPAPPQPPTDWRRALRALRALLADPEQTEKAFEVFLAINGDQEERSFQRFLTLPAGRRLLSRRTSLATILADRAALARLPAGSLGRGYLAYLERTGLNPTGLIELKVAVQEQQRAKGEQRGFDPIREWYRDRGILMHDLWHVLTGYGTDDLGEAALLAFTFAQSGGRANGLLTIGAALKGSGKLGVGFLRYLFQAWRRGRKATWLPLLAYEELLPQSLELVRTLAAIRPETSAHPDGIRSGQLRRRN